jgi:serine/threonine-protein phosphatase PGAM5
VCAAGGAAAASLSVAACAPSLAEAASDEQQWLWTIDGVCTLRRDSNGTVRYVGEDGRALSERPAGVPPEAYENRWRSSHPWQPEREPPAEGAPRQSGRVAHHVLLLRHAQYEMGSHADTERVLTPLGVRQAEMAAARLHFVNGATEGFYRKFVLDTMVTSGLTRAIQTADIIAPLLPIAKRTVQPDLNEGRPCLPEPPPSHHARYDNKHADGERIERAFRALCTRPPPTQTSDTYEVVVCHANVIRYVVCRALQLPPEAWLRLSLPHSSITHLVFRANGDVSLKALGDAGHLPPHLVTY